MKNEIKIEYGGKDLLISLFLPLFASMFVDFNSQRKLQRKQNDIGDTNKRKIGLEQ